MLEHSLQFFFSDLVICRTSVYKKFSKLATVNVRILTFVLFFRFSVLFSDLWNIRTYIDSRMIARRHSLYIWPRNMHIIFFVFCGILSLSTAEDKTDEWESVFENNGWEVFGPSFSKSYENANDFNKFHSALTGSKDAIPHLNSPGMSSNSHVLLLPNGRTALTSLHYNLPDGFDRIMYMLSLIHISEPTRPY